MTSKVSAEGLQELKEDEGVKYKAYQDGGGVWTIGVGHTRKVRPGDVATEGQVNGWLQEDLAEAEGAIKEFVNVPLNQNQYDALANFIFNVGVTAFRESTLLELLNQGLYKDAAKQFARWNIDNGKVVKGLVLRRERTTKRFLKPV